MNAPSGEPAAAVQRAIEQFNAGLFWECHETLEDYWGAEYGPLREFYHGFIQIAAAFVHVQRLNWLGATRLLRGGIEKLRPFQPACQGLNVSALLAQIEPWQSALASSGAEGMRSVRLPLPRASPAAGERRLPAAEA